MADRSSYEQRARSFGFLWLTILIGCGASGDNAGGTDNPRAPETPVEAGAPADVATLRNDGTLVDARDGHEYSTVLIGEQRWMAQNLRYQAPDSVGWFCYDDDPLRCDELGALYAWGTARRACPTGWHLPAESDWDRLVDGLGGYGEDTGEAGVAAAALSIDGESGLDLSLVGLRRGTVSAALERMAFYWTSSYSNVENRWELAEQMYGDRAEEMVDTYVMGRHLYRAREGWVLEPSTAPTVGFEEGGPAIAASVRCVLSD